MSQHGTDSGRLSFLDKKDEWTLLAVPLVITVLAAVGWLMGGAKFAPYLNIDLARMVVGLVLFDGVHIIYSLVLVLFVPELKQWTQVRSTGLVKSFWGRTAIVAATLAVAFYFLAISDLTSHIRWVVATFFFIEAFGPSQHTLAQVKGISLCYNSAIRKAGKIGEAETAAAFRIEKIEKRLFLALLVGDMMSFVPSLLLRSHTKLQNLLEPVQACGIAIVVFSAIGILLNASRFPGQRYTNKLLYLSRVLTYPLRIFVTPVYLAITAFHGTEYLIVLRQIVKNSDIGVQKRKKILLGTAIASFCYAPVFLWTSQSAMNGLVAGIDPDKAFLAALWFHLVVRYTHYYMDRTMYRMNNPATRAAVGPLLVPASSAISAKAAFVPAAESSLG